MAEPLVLLMLILITSFQTLQGFFSALILLVLAVVCSAAAFGFYEDVYELALLSRMPEHGEAMALIAIFLLSLILLRLLVDFGIKGNVMLPFTSTFSTRTVPAGNLARASQVVLSPSSFLSSSYRI